MRASRKIWLLALLLPLLLLERTVSAGIGVTVSATVPRSPLSPVAVFGGPYAAEEGELLTLDGSQSWDPDDAIVSWMWDLDADGVFEADGQSVQVTFPDDGEYPVALRVVDSAGHFGTAQGIVLCLNAVPAITGVTGPSGPVSIEQPVSMTATLTDAGILDTHTAIWEWGDGSVSPGGVVESWGSGVASGQHSYQQPGVYPVTLTIADDDGGSSSFVYRFVVVYDSDAGFVTGGGWFESPQGACTYFPEGVSKATFGFVSKYRNKNAVPEGETQFHLNSADFRFKSTAYEWLVVAGHRAKYQGVGSVNGIPDFGFMVTVVDGTPDTFRMKIWEKTSGLVVYDNQWGELDDLFSGTPLGGGSVIVHGKK